MAQALYCCKKWLNGRLTRFMSYSPCAGGSVPCHDQDPSQAKPAAEGLPKLKPQFEDDPEDPGLPDEDPEGAFVDCYPPETTYDKNRGIIPGDCRPGYEKTTINGKLLCCKRKTGPEYDPIFDDDIPDKPDKPKTAGCIPITKDFIGGKGAGAAFWNDPNGVIPANTVTRSGDWQEHIVWHPENQKFYYVGDLQDFYEGKATEMPKGWNKACPKGYKKVGQECCPQPAEADDAGVSGYWEWPENMQALFKRIEERINFMLDYPRGLTDTEKNAIANYATQRIKRGERGEIQGRRDWLARAGLADSGVELEEIDKIRRGTREDVATVESNLAIDDINRRFAELMGTSSLASTMTGQLAGYETIIESINAARRGEGRMDMGLLLQLLSIITGTGNDSSYNQAIMNYLLNQGA